MGLLNRGRRKTDEDEKLVQSVAYENYSQNKKIEDLILVYDEKTLLLFERPKDKLSIKKI
jgi:vacuolar-type H+-ATPase subunit B/Vma2